MGIKIQSLFTSFTYIFVLNLKILSYIIIMQFGLRRNGSQYCTALTSRKRKREEYKNIILLYVACVVHMVISVVTWYHNSYFVKEPTRNWELERHSFLNHLYRGIEKDCIEQLRLSKSAFFNLCRILQEKEGLVRTRNVPTTEAIAMFLHILAHNLKYRVVQFSYCRSKETISSNSMMS